MKIVRLDRNRNLSDGKFYDSSFLISLREDERPVVGVVQWGAQE